MGGLYDFIVATFGWWNENVTSRMIPFGEDVAEKAKLVFNFVTPQIPTTLDPASEGYAEYDGVRIDVKNMAM